MGGTPYTNRHLFSPFFLLNAVKLNLIQVTEVVTTERFIKNCKECKIFVYFITKDINHTPNYGKIRKRQSIISRTR